MLTLNWNAVALVGFCAALGALLGSVLVGLTVGLGLVVLASFVIGPKRARVYRRR